MKRQYYTEGVGKKLRFEGPTRIVKRSDYHRFDAAAKRRNVYDDWAAAPLVSGAVFNPGFHSVPSKAHRFTVAPINLSDHFSAESASSQLINLPSDMKRKSDKINSRSYKRFDARTNVSEKVQSKLFMKIDRPLKGVGFTPIGDPFLLKPRTLSHDFAIDLDVSMGKRDWIRSQWRHMHSDYTDTADHTLSPALCSTDRKYDGVVCQSAVRKGKGHGSEATTVFRPSLNLFDIEIASWNANSLKLINDASVNPNPSIGQVDTLKVMADYQTSGLHGKLTPFKYPNVGLDYSGQRRTPFLVNLGPGLIKFVIQNKLPTDCELEIVVGQVRDDLHKSYSTTNHFTEVEKFAQDSYYASKRGPNFAVRLSGESLDSSCLDDPSKPFLRIYPKYLTSRPSFRERSRSKFLLAGGAVKDVSIALPARVYNSLIHTSMGDDPTVDSPSAFASVKLESFMVWIALNGVVMPVFSAPLASTSALDYVNETVLDRQTCPAAIMITGTYTEHPRPALSTVRSTEYDLDGEIKDVVIKTGVSTTSLFYNDTRRLISGIVAPEPIAVTTGQVRAVSVPNEDVPTDQSLIN